MNITKVYTNTFRIIYHFAQFIANGQLVTNCYAIKFNKTPENDKGAQLSQDNETPYGKAQAHGTYGASNLGNISTISLYANIYQSGMSISM